MLRTRDSLGVVNNDESGLTRLVEVEPEGRTVHAPASGPGRGVEQDELPVPARRGEPCTGQRPTELEGHRLAVIHLHTHDAPVERAFRVAAVDLGFEAFGHGAIRRSVQASEEPSDRRADLVVVDQECVVTVR